MDAERARLTALAGLFRSFASELTMVVRQRDTYLEIELAGRRYPTGDPVIVLARPVDRHHVLLTDGGDVAAVAGLLLRDDALTPGWQLTAVVELAYLNESIRQYAEHWSEMAKMLAAGRGGVASGSVGLADSLDREVDRVLEREGP